MLGSVSLSSSEDPQKLAKTVEGIILMLGSVIILVAAKFGIGFTSGDVQAIATQAGQLAVVGSAAIGTVFTIFGLLRKFVVFVAERRG